MSRIYESLKSAAKAPSALTRTKSTTTQSSVTPTLQCAERFDMQEEMITLYQKIDHLLPDTLNRAIQFVGSRTGEGTSVIAREFANVARNSFGKSVLIIDGNTRCLDQCAFFGVSPSMTLLDVLKNTQLPVCDALYSVKNPDIFISAITQGDTSVHGIINAKTMRDLLDSLKKQFDLIVIDSAPALSSTDGVGISSSVDGVVLILEAETTRWQVAEETKNRILRNGGNILGIVLNKRQYYTPEFIYKRL